MLKIASLLASLFMVLNVSFANEYYCTTSKNQAENETIKGRTNRSGSSYLDKKVIFSDKTEFHFRAELKHQQMHYLAIKHEVTGLKAVSNGGDNISIVLPSGDEISISCFIFPRAVE